MDIYGLCIMDPTLKLQSTALPYSSLMPRMEIDSLGLVTLEISVMEHCARKLAHSSLNIH